MTYIREIWPHSHFPQLYRALEYVIAWCTSPFPPFSLNVRPGIIGSNLLAVTIETAICGINAAAAFSHARFWHRISVFTLFICLRIKVSDLQIRNKSKAHPREREGGANSKNEWRKTFHQWATISSGSGLTGFKNVGTLAVRPSPKSIKPK